MPQAPRTICLKKPAPRKQSPKGNSHQRGYSRRWRKRSAQWLSEQFAAGNVYCAECGKPLPGDRSKIVVDHIVDHEGDMELFWDESNWQALHHSPCHGKKTMRDQKRRR